MKHGWEEGIIVCLHVLQGINSQGLVNAQVDGPDEAAPQHRRPSDPGANGSAQPHDLH